MSSQPTNPTQPPKPIAQPNLRPGVVTLAGSLMIIGAVVGLISATALFVASGGVVQGFRDRAMLTEATQSDIDSIANVIRSVFLVGATATLVLAIIVAALAYGVFRGSNAARVMTVVLLVLSLCCGVGTSSSTAFGRNANWTINVDNANQQLAKDIGQAYSDAIPTWLVGTTGGLSCLQLLSYLAVIVLLFLPAANAFFRRTSAAIQAPPAMPPPPPAMPPGPPSAMPPAPPAAPPGAAGYPPSPYAPPYPPPYPPEHPSAPPAAPPYSQYPPPPPTTPPPAPPAPPPPLTPPPTPPPPPPT